MKKIYIENYIGPTLKQFSGSGLPPTQAPLGMFLIGGRGPSSNGLLSAEVVGLDNCTLPDLPEWRYNHGSFVTEWGSLAVCGGWWDGKPFSSDCLVLDKTSKRWERGLLGSSFGNTVLGVANMDVGTYLIHPTTSSFLPSGKQE